MADAEDWNRHICHRDEIVLQQWQAWVPRWQAHIERIATHLGVSISYDVIAARNAYAFPVSKRIEISPITSPETYAAALHEEGHCTKPCQSSHRRVQIDTFKSCCIRCELEALQWARARAIEWSREMQAELARCIETYRQHATAVEDDEIRQLQLFNVNER